MKKTLFLTTIFIILLNQNLVHAKNFCEEFDKNRISETLGLAVSTGFFMGYNYAKNTNYEPI